MGKRKRLPAEGHLIPSQPAEQPTHPQQQKKKEKKNDEQSLQHQQTIDHLLSEVSIPQIRSSAINKNQDGKKRGTVRKLGQLVPNQTIQPCLVSLSGHRLLRNPVSTGSGGSGQQELVLTISRKKAFSVYLKRALAHLRKPHPTPLLIRAMGCAISMAFSLALAIESHLHIAPPASLLKSLATGTVVVGDEVTPNSENIAEPELVYQTRNQASIEIKLSIKL